MAARQLLPHRRRNPHRQAPFAGGLQPRAAAPAQWPVGRAAARLRPRAADRGAWRRPARARHAEPVRVVVPDGEGARARRAVGVPDHAAAGADRKPAPRRSAHRCRPRAAQPRHGLGRQDARRGRARSEGLDPRHRRHGPLRPADDRTLRRRAGTPASGPQCGARAAAHLDRAAPGRVAPEHRADGAGRGPAPGHGPGVGQQQHRQPAPDRRDGLARVRRDAEPRRADAARGSGRGLRTDGLRHPRQLPPRGRGDGAHQPAVGGRSGARGDRAGERVGGAARRRQPASRPMWAIT